MIEYARTDSSLALLDGERRQVGQLRIASLPSSKESIDVPLLLDRTGDLGLGPAAPIQLLEDAEYEYSFEGFDRTALLEPANMFSSGRHSPLAGRLRPGRATGTVRVLVLGEDAQVVGTCEFEVRSRKLDYLEEYRWMLGRIADEAAEALLMRFAPSEVALVPTLSGSPQTLYQRFALLQALLEKNLDTALTLITHRPHGDFRSEIERTDPARGLRPGSSLVRTLTAPGPRMRASVGRLETLPEQVERVIHIETVDTVPNRFVKHALIHWRALVVDVQRALDGSDISSPVARGIRETRTLEDWLDLHLQSPLFADVAPLTSFPAGNQVLQRREGYRDVFRAFLMLEVLAVLDWEGGDDVFRAGQRDVATLYEYWVFLELARILSRVSDPGVRVADLFVVDQGRIGMRLQQRSEAVLEGHTIRKGRRVRIQLFFNRQFSESTGGSWTVRLRPDCSVRFSIDDVPTVETWLHFDAKYRLHELATDFAEEGDDSEPEEDPSPLRSSEVTRGDLLKMHAYRDAVRRSSGAYVLYPGSDDYPSEGFRMYHEVLPGLGAFVLRPTADGEAAAAGADALSSFLDDALDHLVADGTSRQRAGFWEEASYAGWPTAGERRLSPVPFLSAPADDTKVLLGYLKNAEHRAWVEQQLLYNVRADAGRNGAIGLSSEELRASLLVLYGNDESEASLFRLSGALYLRTFAELEQTEYPQPRGTNYICLEIAERIEAAIPAPAAEAVARAGRDRRDWARPMVLTWAELQTSLGIVAS